MAAALKKDHEAEGREMVCLLLAAGADATAQNTQHGSTALHTTAMANDVELVKTSDGNLVVANGSEVSSHPVVLARSKAARGAELVGINEKNDNLFKNSSASVVLDSSCDTEGTKFGEGDSCGSFNGLYCWFGMEEVSLE